MQQEFSFTVAGVRGRERKRLAPKFALTTFRFEHGLRERLVDACGTDCAFRFGLGRALHRHSAGISGPVSFWNAVLNEHLLMTQGQEVCGNRWFISWHKVADVLVEIATEINSGETRVRRPYLGRHLSLSGVVSEGFPCD